MAREVVLEDAAADEESPGLEAEADEAHDEGPEEDSDHDQI